LQRAALNGVKQLWESYRDLDDFDLSATAPDEISLLADELEFFDIASRELDNEQRRGSRADEYETYLSRDHGKIEGSALNWWLCDGQRRAWPRLSQMAIDILSIPAMSGEPERVFFWGSEDAFMGEDEAREHGYWADRVFKELDATSVYTYD
jgi:hAT family C-terminal dimerisation region